MAWTMMAERMHTGHKLPRLVRVDWYLGVAWLGWHIGAGWVKSE